LCDICTMGKKLINCEIAVITHYTTNNQHIRRNCLNLYDDMINVVTYTYVRLYVKVIHGN